MFFFLFVWVTWIYVLSHVHLVCRPSGKNYNVWRYMETSFIPAMLIGTIDFHHFMPLSVAFNLTLAGGHKVSVKQNLLTPFSHTLFNWMGWNLIWWWSISLLSESSWIKGKSCCFIDCIRNCNVGMHSVYELIWFKQYTRVPDQNGVSQAWSVVEMNHSGREPSI